MHTAIRHIDLPAHRRVFAVSDVHGEPDYLKGLLDKIAFSPDDILILLGDLIEKGPRSIETLQYIMGLCKTHTVYVLRGNCDGLLFDENLPDEWLFHYRNGWGGNNVLSEFARRLGMSINSPADVELLRRAVRREFPEEVDFLLSLPLVLVSEHYIFVHGGIPGEDCLDDPAGLDHWNCMKNDDFLRQGYRFHKKWCIVGHWPATLYREDHPCADPLVSPEQQIVSIDGGCAIKRDGQLNALRLPPVPAADAFTWESYDPLPKGVALDPQAPSEQPIYIRFGDNLLEILERGEEFCLCRHKATGKVLSILTKDVWEKHDRIVCEDSTDYLLPVQPGDVLFLIDSTSRGWLAKKDGCTGWYTGRLREEG